MKKYLALILGVLFVFAFAANAFAVHEEVSPVTVATGAQVSLGGEIEIWNWWRDNLAEPITDPLLNGLLPRDAGANAFSMTRVRISASIKASDNVMGMIELESVGNESEQPGFMTWGSLDNKITGTGTPTALGSSPTGVGFRQAWILYTGSGLLGVPSGLKIGHMPLILGLGKFFNHTREGDDAIVLFADATKQLHFLVGSFKVAENSLPSAGNDVDVYFGTVVYNIDDKNTVGTYYVYVSDPSTAVALRSLQNAALFGNFDWRGLKINAEIDQQFGKLTRGGTEMKAEGFLAYVDLGYKLDPINLRGTFAYGSGDNDATDDKIKSFIPFLGPDMNVNTFIYEYQALSASAVTDSVGFLSLIKGSNISGLSNTVLYNLGIDYNPMKDLGLSLDGSLIRAAKNPSGISKNVGFEVDATSVYQVSKGLTWTLRAGLFAPGAFYEDAGFVAEKKTALAARSELALKF